MSHMYTCCLFKFFLQHVCVTMSKRLYINSRCLPLLSICCAHVQTIGIELQLKFTWGDLAYVASQFQFPSLLVSITPSSNLSVVKVTLYSCAFGWLTQSCILSCSVLDCGVLILLCPHVNYKFHHTSYNSLESLS